MTSITHTALISFVESLVSGENGHLNINPTILTGFGSNKQSIQIGGKTPALTVAHNLMKGLVSSARFEANKVKSTTLSDEEKELMEMLGEGDGASENFSGVEDTVSAHALAVDLLSVALQIEPIVMAMGGALGHTESFYKISSGTIPEVSDLVKDASFIMFTSEERARGADFMKARKLAEIKKTLEEARDKKAFMESLLEDASEDHLIQDPEAVAKSIGWGLDVTNNYGWLPEITSLVQECEDRIIKSSNKFKNVDRQQSAKSVANTVSLWNGINAKTGEAVSTVETLIDDLLAQAYDGEPDIH